jgi:hypothetical protein
MTFSRRSIHSHRANLSCGSDRTVDRVAMWAPRGCSEGSHARLAGVKTGHPADFEFQLSVCADFFKAPRLTLVRQGAAMSAIRVI